MEPIIIQAIIWVAIIAILCIAEAITISLICIWFIAGAFAAFMITVFGGGFILQIIAFIVISGLGLVIVRPTVRRHIDGQSIATNADMIIGQEAVVTEEINNLQGTGKVSVNGSIWTARAENRICIPEGTVVVINRIVGVKAMVEAKEEEV